MKDELKLYLLVDRDDVTVKSAPIIQNIINEKTNFKTEVLSMFEQLKRNCRYFLDEVIKAYDGKKNWVDINAAKYYLYVADLFLNQFLEERDTFLEIDNMPEGARKYFNYDKEMAEIIKYSVLIDKNKQAFHVINAFCLERIERIIEEAKKRNTIPVFGSLFSMDVNDIIKKNSIGKEATREYILYEKPIEMIKNCIKNENRMHDIVANACVFFQPSKELINYREIHSLKNVNWDAVDLVEELMHSGIFTGVYESSHHTGAREDKVKRETNHIIFPESNGYLGQRFHAEEHDVVRRGRSSKVRRAALLLGISPSQIVLLDDSAANCMDAESLNAAEIYYKPVADSERINGKLQETGLDRITDFKNHGAVYGIIAKTLVKKREKRR